jgi:biotin operon repressor
LNQAHLQTRTGTNSKTGKATSLKRARWSFIECQNENCWICHRALKVCARNATLQGRVGEMMVHPILMGLVPAGAKVPPSRSMAAALGLSRNTVSLALKLLVDKGFLISSSRSGLIVNGDTLLGKAHQAMPLAAAQSGLQWDARPVSRMERQRNIIKPAN